jgi:RNA polymerase sigma factor (sigma-70 family)
MATVLNRQPRTQLAILNDGQLLGRYVSRNSQEAFAVLVQRHGPMVLGVCRRVLHHDQDTEDAFQAAFVVLARKARSILKFDSVASWLYKVAFRIALRARSTEARRQAHARHNRVPAAPRETELAEIVRREFQEVLDEEVHRLPEKYRAPILLCYLQGQTNEEAAAQLHCPTGTVKIRLLRAREILRKRLVRRGLALSAIASLGLLLTDMASAAVPQPLARATAALATTMHLPPAVASLVESTLKGMCLAKLKVAAVVLVTLALTCLADGLFNRANGATLAEQRQIQFNETPPTAVQHHLVASLKD